MDRLMIIIKSGPEEEGRVMEALRLSTSLIGMDYPIIIVFTGRGVDCLRRGVIEDPYLRNYLQAASDLSEIFVLYNSVNGKGLDTESMDDELVVKSIDLDYMKEMLRSCGSAVAY